MIKHIVFFRFKAGANGATGVENAATLAAMLEALPASIPEIIALEVGHDFARNPAAWDLSLYTEFKSKADLAVYQDHPEHVKVKQFVGLTTSERAVVDYEA